MDNLSRQKVLYDVKWQKLLRRTWLFAYVPFIDFALGSGSIAIGNVTETSDFDVLIGAQQKRIFTARFFAILFFGLFGWRRKKTDHGLSAADKICLNHFVTPASYRFSLLANAYWELMYANLVPVYGDERFIRIFFEANKKLVPQRHRNMTDMRYLHKKSSFFKRSMERLLDGRLGDWFEKKVKAMQIERIESGLVPANQNQKPHHIVIHAPDAKSATYTLAPLIRYNDNELEFHPDPAIIEIRSI
jgi:hypothetical protein